MTGKSSFALYVAAENKASNQTVKTERFRSPPPKRERERGREIERKKEEKPVSCHPYRRTTLMAPLVHLSYLNFSMIGSERKKAFSIWLTNVCNRWGHTVFQVLLFNLEIVSNLAEIASVDYW